MQFIIDTGNDAGNESVIRQALNKLEKNRPGIRFTEKHHKTHLFFDYKEILKIKVPDTGLSLDNEYSAYANMIIVAEKFKADCNIDLLQQKINDHINLLKTQLQEDPDE